MTVKKSRCSTEELARRGDEIYDRKIRPLVPQHRGEFAAIDVKSGAYEIDKDHLTSVHRLRKRFPNAQIWGRKVGYRYLVSFGGHRRHDGK